MTVQRRSLGVFVGTEHIYYCGPQNVEGSLPLPPNWNVQIFCEELQKIIRLHQIEVVVIATSNISTNSFCDPEGNQISMGNVSQRLGGVRVLGILNALALAYWYAHHLHIPLTAIDLGVMIITDVERKSKIQYFFVNNGRPYIHEGNTLVSMLEGPWPLIDEPVLLPCLALEFWEKIGRGSVHSLLIWSRTPSIKENQLEVTEQIKQFCGRPTIPLGVNTMSRGVQLAAQDM